VSEEGLATMFRGIKIPNTKREKLLRWNNLAMPR